MCKNSCVIFANSSSQQQTEMGVFLLSFLIVVTLMGSNILTKDESKNLQATS